MASKAGRGQETEPPFRRPDFLNLLSFGPPSFSESICTQAGASRKRSRGSALRDRRSKGGLSVTKRACLNAILRTAFAAGASLLVAAGTAVAQKNGGSITVGQELEIPGFDPLKVGVFDTAAQTAAAAIFDTLTYLDDKGEPQPKLALSWTHSDDYKTWTYKLRPNVKFHDGTPFNAQAVKENFDRQKDPANKCRCAFYISHIHDVQAPDELTLVYNLNDPSVNAPALASIPSANGVVQSPTAWKTKGDDYNRNPVGTGPYPEILDRGRPHGAGEESGLLEQGPSLS